MALSTKIQDLSMKFCKLILFKFPLFDALSLLMLLAERAQKEDNPPIHPKLVYAYLIVCIGCAVMLTSGYMQKATCLVYSGLMLYFTLNFYTNPKWEYPEWQILMMSIRQFGVLAIYTLLAYVLDNKRSDVLRRIGEIFLGLHLMSYVYLINSVALYKTAFLAHIIGGDYMRYLIAVTLAGCALSFLSGYFLRDMALCASVTLLFTTVFVDLDLTYWKALGAHQWNMIRQILNSACSVIGLLYLFFTTDNKLKFKDD